MDNEYPCPRCNGIMVHVNGKMHGYLFCLPCGLAVSEEYAEAHAAEVADGEKA